MPFTSSETPIIADRHRPRDVLCRMIVTVFGRKMNEGAGILFHPRAEQDTVDHGKDADVESKTEREGKCSSNGERGLACDGPKGVAKILDHVNEDGQKARIITRLPPARHGFART